MPESSALPAHYIATFSSFMDEFIGESDRAAVILGASKVEYLLGEILDKFLLPTPSSPDDLLDGDSPIGTFSAKIKLCHRLGLIDDHFAKLLNTFRKLRNGFAHEVTSSSLNTGSARDRVASLAEPFVRTEFFQSTLKKIATQMNRQPADHGVTFRTALAVFHVQLIIIQHYIAPIQRQSAKTIVEMCGETKTPFGGATK